MRFVLVVPIIIGGVMTYYDYLSGASFVAIYLVSHNIGYQFNELSYFINTTSRLEQLRERYSFLLQDTSSQMDDQASVPLFLSLQIMFLCGLKIKYSFKNYL